MKSNPQDQLERCNHTELLQLCRRNGFRLHPGTDRETMIGLLNGEDLDWRPDPLDSARNGLIQLTRDHWRSLEVQLKCPLIELGPPEEDTKPEPNHPSFPRACYRCPGARVVNCLVDNIEHDREITLRRKDNPVMTNTAFTIDNMPTDAEELAKLPVFRMPALYKELWVKVNGSEDAESKQAEFRGIKEAEKKAKLLADLKGKYDAKNKGGKTTVAGKGAKKAPAPEEEEGAAEEQAEEEKPKKTFAGKGAAAKANGTGNGASKSSEGHTLDEIWDLLLEQEKASANRTTRIREDVETTNGLLITVLAGLAAAAGADADSVGEYIESLEPLAQAIKDASAAK